ncbi:DNA-binding transcriptional regulator, XRE-family HTH domain [Paenibacillus sp. 1_12]|uniref:helix-turn-helix domain-containing protein n=1 Tax=Paenibacillus sp. 1_12 TaxID=1566278 RepID=UPI0008F3B0FF|nr:helix-turn-helix transcriptional regulator [Paenibacillus sp. 1_12]SFM12349.1 DNA-binding transcriptional regulator, XRE-family HTH domain [Paenibacillus sp. 1_12]
MDIRTEFGKRVRELRARSGISQEFLADRAGLDRTYISGVERGERNVSIINIEKIAAALNVSIEYMFSSERFSTNPAYLKKDFEKPFSELFTHQVDTDKKLITFQVKGVLNAENTDKLASIVLGACSMFDERELSIFVDHREMKASDGEVVVYSPEVVESAMRFQERLNSYSKQIVVLCNSQFMVNQFNQTMQISGIYEKTANLFGSDKDMLGKAYELLDIHSNELIKPFEINRQ